MAPLNRGYTAAVSLLKNTRSTRICPQCIFASRVSITQTSYRRTYAVAAASIQSSSSSSPSSPPPTSKPLIRQQPPVTPVDESKRKKKPSPNRPPLPEYRIQGGVLLSRPPLLTRELHPFEESFFLYQKRLNERLVLPFTRYFYFKKGTPADIDWKLKAKARNGIPARDVGGYAPYSKTGWADELLISEKAIQQKQTTVEELIKDSISRINEDGSKRVLAEEEEEAALREVRPLPRTTRSDEKKALTKLDRKLDGTLYLIVKGAAGWQIPAGDLIGREPLHEAAERIIVQTAGTDMNTWVVGRVPIGHRIVPATWQDTPSSPAESPETPTPSPTLLEQGTKTFFLKARIMTGQANIAENKFGLDEFRWATRDEAKKLLGAEYWRAVKSMFIEQ